MRKVYNLDAKKLEYKEASERLQNEDQGDFFDF